MKACEVKECARRWTVSHGARTPGFVGAFFHGSVNWMADDEELAPASDIDVMLVLEISEPPAKPGKFLYEGVMLEASYLPAHAIQDAQQVLGEYNLAGSFHRPSVIADPSGHLTKLQHDVAAEYANRRWVRIRSRQAYDKALNGLEGLDEAAALHDQVITWLFATGVMTHVLLVAGLCNPTVRRRYSAVRDLLDDYGLADYYAVLLKLLGCKQMTPAQVGAQLAVLSEAFDAAVSALRSPIHFASDISELARPVAIDGCQALISRGEHREAVFWLAVTYSRCMQVFQTDAPELLTVYDAGYRRLLRELSIRDSVDLLRRRDAALQEMARLWQMAERIMAENPAIWD